MAATTNLSSVNIDTTAAKKTTAATAAEKMMTAVIVRKMVKETKRHKSDHKFVHTTKVPHVLYITVNTTIPLTSS